MEKTKSQTEPAGASGDAGEHVGARHVFPWLVRRKVTVPDRVAGYVHRAELVERVLPTRRRLTVLTASSGFGKTTVLAECCRKLRGDGVAAAWVLLDEQDVPAVLEAYIAFACLDAGLDLPDVHELEDDSTAREGRIGAMLSAIRAHAGPFVIAFDELERLNDPASVALLERLLQHGPSNLHLAMACRRIPDGLDVAGAVFEGRARLVSTHEFRFSRSEVAQFFDGTLSRRQLTAEMQLTSGWPIALRMSRNRTDRGPETTSDVVQTLVTNWLETRVLADLSPEDRDLVLDIGLFEWMDAALLDEVLQHSGSMRRLDALPELVGLLEPFRGGESASRRLHPLVREHCAAKRLSENPRRFRSVHRRIAKALEYRRETVPAMRHAIEADDRALAGDILERAGGVRLWVRLGLEQMQAADRLLSERALSARPRLALVRCLTLIMSGQLEAARTRFRDVSAIEPTDSQDEQDAEFEYSVDKWIVRGVFFLYGGEPVGSESTRLLFEEYARLAASPRLDRLSRGYMEYGLCVIQQLKANFGAALERFARIEPFLARNPYMKLYGHWLRGQVAMAQGRVQEAESQYRRAQRMARGSYVLDPVPAALARIMLQELALERGRLSRAQALRGVPRAVMGHGTPLSAFASACGVAIELRLWEGRAGEALDAANDLLGHVRGIGLPALARYLAAMRVSLLASTGRIEDAAQAWRFEGLPDDPKDCVDLSGQSWREMEAVSCARLRWLIASERYEEGCALVHALLTATAQRQLRRTQMRALALAVVLERAAEEPGRALEHLERYLGLYRDSPYAWPLVRERAECAPVLTVFLDRNSDSSARKTAWALLDLMRRADGVRGPVLGERERQVLLRLDRQLDKQIAAELGLSVHGVRYHIRNLFTKLGAGSRAEAVRRARDKGLIPDDD